MARTHEDFSIPEALRFPGSRYCANADCPPNDSAGGSTGRVDPPWVTSYGWQGFAGQNQFVEFGKIPFAEGENGGIHGHVVYTSTRPFDDPALLLQLTWEPMVPHVTINLYQKGTAPDGSTSLKLVDTTTTSSWDDARLARHQQTLHELPGRIKRHVHVHAEGPAELPQFWHPIPRQQFI
jgi:hypothetical protein